MKRGIASGKIKGTKVLQIVNPPRKVDVELMVPMMRNGKVLGYQSLSDNDMNIYWGGIQ